MTNAKEAQAQARADRLADLVEDTELRRQILTLAAEWRRSAWNAAAGILVEPRSFRSGEDAPGERGGPTPPAPTPTPRRPAPT